jgi:hypothetical protein
MFNVFLNEVFLRLSTKSEEAVIEAPLFFTIRKKIKSQSVLSQCPFSMLLQLGKLNFKPTLNKKKQTYTVSNNH